MVNKTKKVKVEKEEEIKVADSPVDIKIAIIEENEPSAVFVEGIKVKTIGEDCGDSFLCEMEDGTTRHVSKTLFE
jgi:hypothetical protein